MSDGSRGGVWLGLDGDLHHATSMIHLQCHRLVPCVRLPRVLRDWIRYFIIRVEVMCKMIVIAGLLGGGRGIRVSRAVRGEAKVERVRRKFMVYGERTQDKNRSVMILVVNVYTIPDKLAPDPLSIEGMMPFCGSCSSSSSDCSPSSSSSSGYLLLSRIMSSDLFLVRFS